MDARDSSPLRWSVAVLAYQTLHTFQKHFLAGSWGTAQPKRFRLWFFRLPDHHAWKDLIPVRLARSGRFEDPGSHISPLNSVTGIATPQTPKREIQK